MCTFSRAPGPFALLVKLLLSLTFFSNYAGAQVEKTGILILGTQHLERVEEFEPTMLDQLIDELAEKDFDVIAIEAMPTELLYDLRSRRDPAYDELLEDFGGDRLVLADQMQQSADATFLEAQTRIADILDQPALSANDRHQLITLFIAAGDLASATLHYAHLKSNNALDSGTTNDESVELLGSLLNSANESYSIGVRLALQQEIDRIEYIDNFVDETLLLKHYPDFIAYYQSRQDSFARALEHEVFKQVNEKVANGLRAGNLIELFRFLNNQSFQQQDIEAQWDIWLDTKLPNHANDARLLYWEMRNLQIAANIIKVAARHPSQRLLVIIGASHKSFIEKHLETIPSVELLTL